VSMNVRKRLCTPMINISIIHKGLLNKRGPDFWKCWRSKFECEKRHDYLIDGTSNNKETIDKFVDYFKKIGCNLSENGNKALYDKYVSRRENYTGFVHSTVFEFDAGLVECVINDVKRGKSPRLDGLSAEHLQYSHPAVCMLLSNLFNLIMEIGCVPDDFGLTHTVPLPKKFQQFFKVTDCR